MKASLLSATEAARGFGDLLARVRYRRESFLIRRGRTVVARLGPVDVSGVTGTEAAAAWRRGPRLTPRESEAFAKELRTARNKVVGPPKSPWER